jgi:hypothetical protein
MDDETSPPLLNWVARFLREMEIVLPREGR